MTEANTFFKAGHDGGPELVVDTRRPIPGSTLKARPEHKLKATWKPKRTRVQLAVYTAVRVEVRHRAQGRCEATLLGFPGCEGEGSVCHHIIQRAEPYQGPDDIDNCAWLCPPCHHHVHNNGIEAAKAAGYLAHVRYRSGDPLPWQNGKLVPLDAPKGNVA